VKGKNILKTFRDISNQRGIVYGILFFQNYFLLKIFRSIHLPGGYAWPYLTRIQIEPTKKCNMRCPMCTNTYLKKEEKGNMSYEDFLEIMKQFPFLRSVKLQGLGEILLNKDAIRMIRYCKRQGMEVRFNDNASLLTSEIIKELLDTNLDSIQFSLDTLKKEKYEEMRGVNQFERVKSNLEEFASMRNMNGKYRGIRLGITMVTMDNNLEELPAMVEYASKLGLDNVISSLALMKASSKGQSKIVKKGTGNLSVKEEADKIKKKAIDDSHKLGIRLSFIHSRKKRALNCKWPWKNVYITYDGYITPCCHLEDPKVFNFGNILETPFSKIWNGERYREFRKKFFDWNSICRKCPHILFDERKHEA